MLQKRKRGLRLRGEGYSFDAPIQLERLYTRQLYNGNFCKSCRYNIKTSCMYGNYCNAWGD